MNAFAQGAFMTIIEFLMLLVPFDIAFDDDCRAKSSPRSSFISNHPP
jgi:hypothetical protein